MHLQTMLIAPVFFMLFFTGLNYFSGLDSENNCAKIDVVSDLDVSFQLNFEEENFERGFGGVLCCHTINPKLFSKQVRKFSVFQVSISNQFRNNKYLNSDLAPPSQLFLQFFSISQLIFLKFINE